MTGRRSDARRIPATQPEPVAIREPTPVPAANDVEFLSRATPAVRDWAHERALALVPRQGWEGPALGQAGAVAGEPGLGTSQRTESK